MTPKNETQTKKERTNSSQRANRRDLDVPRGSQPIEVTQTYLRGGMPCKESEPWYFHLKPFV